MNDYKPNVETQALIEDLVEDLFSVSPEILGIDEVIPGCEVVNVDPYATGAVPRWIRVALRGEYYQDVYFRGNIAALAVGDVLTVVHMRDGNIYEVLGIGGTGGVAPGIPAPANQNEMLLANATPEWNVLAAPTAAGQALVPGGAPFTPIWTTAVTWGGTHTWASGAALLPTDAVGQNLGDGTHLWDLFTREVSFGGASGTNRIAVPDNVANAWYMVDAGGSEYCRVVSTNTDYYFGFGNQAATMFGSAATADKAVLINFEETTDRRWYSLINMLEVNLGGNSANRFYAAYHYAVWNNAHDITVGGRLFGLWAGASHSGAGTLDVAVGGETYVACASTGTITNAWGFEGHIAMTAAGIITNAYGVMSRLKKTAAGTITNWYGFYAVVEDAAATLTNGYGLYIADITATNGWGVYQVGTDDTNYFAGNVGLGTPTVPHGGIGCAKLALEGANASAAGPHVQVTTASDDYPLLQMLNWSHDNVAFCFDAYHDGSVWRSSDAGSNAWIYKVNDHLTFYYSSGVAAGNTIPTLNVGVTLDLATGYVGVRVAAPARPLDVAGVIRNSTSADASPYTQERITVYNDGLNWGYLAYGSDADMRIVYSNASQNHNLHIGVSSAYDNTGAFTSRMTILGSGNVGFSRTAPDGLIHGYRTVSGFIHWDYDGLGAVAQTVITGGAGDVLYGLRVVSVVRDSGGGFQAGEFTATWGGGAVQIYNDGVDILTIIINPGGDVTVQRAAGAATFKIGLWLIWL